MLHSPPTPAPRDRPLQTEEPPLPAGYYVPVPSSAQARSTPPSSLTPLVCDERAIARLLGTLLARGGLTTAEASRRLGVHTNVIRQYLAGRRYKPSLIWFVRFVELCGARLTIEFPPRS